MKPFSATSQPNPITGVGLRHLHYSEALSNISINQNIDFVELHAENFFADGGIARELLNDVAEKYLVSIHGTSLGLGSALDVPDEILDKFAQVVDYCDASLVSEHLCFNRAEINGQVLHSGDLLPVAYNQSCLDLLVDNIDKVQEKLGRAILIENLSAYLPVSSLDLKQKDSMTEMAFLIALCKQAGCGLLLDLNNLIVNALNAERLSQDKHKDPAQIVSHIIEKISVLPPNLIGEIHLAGFSDNQVNGFIVDDHANSVSAQCWALYEASIGLFGHKPTLIEWDNQLPAWEQLVAQADKAKALAVLKK